ncbi:MAG: homoserine dehydrogenase [Thermodesulfobacteriota bacterium]
MRDICIGLLGCGTVGTGVAKLLLENRELIRSRLGAYLNLKLVADIDTQTDRGVRFDDGVFITDGNRVVNDPDIDIVVEMIGGETIAKKFILQAIENGKHVVTANKKLLAAQGNLIIDAANQKGVDIGFEASVGGCMPIIKTMREALVGNHIQSMVGILNGTCNYILTKITDTGMAFEEALAEAQANGFAEADPSLDVDGHDTAHKLAILTALAYGMKINLNDIYLEGISRITPMDIQFAGECGYRIKLLAISKLAGDAVEARVHPAMIPVDNMLAHVNESLNAITVCGDAVGEILLYGRGAGKMPTASAVISDLVDIARNHLLGVRNRIPVLSYQPNQIRSLSVRPIDQIRTHYYFRFSAADHPGVLSRIAGILGDCGISIQSVHQKGRKFRGAVPIVMLTHQAREADIRKALDRIKALDVIKDEPVLIRIEGEDEEE